MARIKKKRKENLLFLFLGIIIGVLIGIFALVVLISSSLDQYHKEIYELKNMVEERDMQLEKLNDTINNNKIIIKEIKIKLDSKEIEEDEILGQQVEKAIKGKLKIVIGKELENIDMELLSSIIDKTIINIDNEDYMIYLKRMLVGEKIKIWVGIKGINST